ncbi:MAG: homoserine dehydrogenase [Pirellulales bacterium]|nr:homoserine dehydrogenase [Pirellulales bacterium]
MPEYQSFHESAVMVHRQRARRVSLPVRHAAKYDFEDLSDMKQTIGSDNMTQPIHIGLVGMGTVGTGVVRVLQDSADHIARQAGRPLIVEHVVVQDLKKPRSVKLSGNRLSTDVRKIIDDPAISVVAVLLGGIEPARTICLELLRSGKDLVTANKALLAEHGPELFQTAREAGRSIAFEAAIGGGIPIVAAISECLTGNRISSIRGILNGTSNFILTKMEQDGSAYQDVLCLAQAEGYAEADPTMDVDGTDATQKLAILAHLAFGQWVPWTSIPRVGLETIDQELLRFADELGCRIRVVADANRSEEGLSLRVGPALVRKGTPLAETQGAFNAVSVVGDAVGPLFFHGLGAGQMPTASAVVADIIGTVVGRSAITFQQAGNVGNADNADTNIHGGQSPIFLRLHVADTPGVLADLTGILGAEGISIDSVIQHPAEKGQPGVPLIIMTHCCPAEAVYRAVNALNKNPAVRSPICCLPVITE